MKAYKLVIVALLSSFCCNAQIYIASPSLILPVTQANIYLGHHMYRLGTNLILIGVKKDGTTGAEWLSYDGNNTLIAAPEITPGSGNGIKTPVFAQKNFGAILNGVIYFSGVDYTSGNEVFKWDGINPPQLVKDIMSGTTDASPSGFTTADNKLYFTADSTSFGTRNVYEYDPITNSITTIKKNVTLQANIATHNNMLYIQQGGSNILQEYNPLTKQFKNISTPGNSNNNFLGYGSKLFYTSNVSGRHLNYYDGNSSNTISASIGIEVETGSAEASHLSKKTIIAYNGKIYFWRTVNSVRNLYYYDTTTNLIQQAPGLNPFTATQHFFFLEHQNKIYYNEGSMLVRYDGTKADTMLPFNFRPSNLEVFNNEIYLSAQYPSDDTNLLFRFKDTLVPYTPPSTIQAVTFNADVTLYPNPADSSATISIDLPVANTLTAVVTDITGKTVYKTKSVLYSTGKSEIPLLLHNLSPGNYIVSLKDISGNMLWSGKLVHQ